LTATATWTGTTYFDDSVPPELNAECAASLDVMRLRRVAAPERYDQGLRLLEAVVAMLTKML
jgi:hypothetical protein